MKALLSYLCALLLFGSNGVVADFISLTSSEIVFWRSFLGSVFLVLFFFLTGHRFHVQKYPKDTLCIILSGIFMAADWLFLFEAYAQIGVSLGMLINYTGPVLVMAFSVYVLKEQSGKYTMLALFICLLGVFFVGGNAAATGIRLTGLGFAALSSVSYAGMVICNKRAKKIVGLENALLQLSSAFVVVAVFVLVKQGICMDMHRGDVLPILWLGVINTGIGCGLYFSSIGALPVHTVSLLGYLEPLSAVVFSAMILQERMTFMQVFGGILILFGSFLGERLGDQGVPQG